MAEEIEAGDLILAWGQVESKNRVNNTIEFTMVSGKVLNFSAFIDVEAFVRNA